MLNFNTIKSGLKNNSPHKLIQRWWYYHSYFKKTCEIINEKKPHEFEIYTVAFNNEKVIDYQIKLMKKNFKDEHQHIIVDNSSDEAISKEIRKICVDSDIMYIKLPKNTLFCSQSHALALNYTWRNVIAKRECLKYFWFLDHDIFPIKETSVLPYLKNQKMYGYLVDKNRRWYLWDWWFIWPWFCFFDKSISKKFNFSLYKNFIPFRALDTGGKNRKHIYKYYKKEDLEFTQRELRGITKNNEDISLNYYQIIDWAPTIENLFYYYEFIKNKEWIHKGSTYYLWDKNSQEYEQYKKAEKSFFNKLDKNNFIKN